MLTFRTGGAHEQRQRRQTQTRRPPCAFFFLPACHAYPRLRLPTCQPRQPQGETSAMACRRTRSGLAVLAQQGNCPCMSMYAITTSGHKIQVYLQTEPSQQIQSGRQHVHGSQSQVHQPSAALSSLWSTRLAASLLHTYSPARTSSYLDSPPSPRHESSVLTTTS